jgi:hypothetical protein
MEQWLPLIGWLAQRRPLDIAPGTPGITSGVTMNALPVTPAEAAAALASPASSQVPTLSSVVTAVAAPAPAPAPSSNEVEVDPATVPPPAPTLG